MILKYISIPELNFSKSWEEGSSKIKSLNSFDKTMTIFWLLGPFIYLIERDPADIWLTSFALIFLIRCVIMKDWDWTGQLWFRFAVLFWLTGILSALLNYETIFSLKEGFVWIRFPLYAVAAQVWIARDRDIRIMMLISMLFGLLLMTIFLVAEIILDPKLRLEWPYGDKVPGGYLAKVSLPLYCCLIAMASRNFNASSIWCMLISIISLIMTFLTGERMNFVLRLCSGILSLFVWKPKIYIFLCMLAIKISIIGIFFVNKPEVFSRFYQERHIDPITNKKVSNPLKTFWNQIPLFAHSDENPYWGSWRSGIHQAIKKPYIGIGPSGTRNNCKNLDSESITWLPGKNHCNNHPHNFYIQMFAETGVIGFIFGTLMVFTIILKCYRIRKTYPDCPMASTCFVVPFAIFFPLQQFGSLFGQWGNLFIWFAISLSICQIPYYEKENN